MSTPSQAERVLQSIETLRDILDQGSDIAALLRDATRALIDIFDCDRAFLSFFKPAGRGGLFEPVVFSRLDESEPGALVFDHDAFTRAAITTARDHDKVVVCGPSGDPIPADSALASKQGVQSMMVAAVQPRLGPAWYMGVHHCAAAHDYGLDTRLLRILGAILADAVTQSVAFEHIRTSQEQIRTFVGHAPGALIILDVGTQRVVECNAEAEQLLGWGPGQLLGAELRQLQPEQQSEGQSSDERITTLLAEVATGATHKLPWTFRKADDEPLACELELVALSDSERLLVRASFSPS